MNPPQSKLLPKIIISLAAVVLAAVVTIAWLKHTSTQDTTNPASSTSQRIELSGTVATMELAGLKSDLPAVYTVNVDGKTTSVYVSPHAPPCDKQAIIIPPAKVGSAVHISGDQGSDGIVHICRSGTYIK